MNATVDFNDKPRLRNCKINDVNAYRKLTTCRISMDAQLPQRLPGDLLGRIRRLAQTSRPLRKTICGHWLNLDQLAHKVEHANYPESEDILCGRDCSPLPLGEGPGVRARASSEEMEIDAGYGRLAMYPHFDELLDVVTLTPHPSPKGRGGYALVFDCGCRILTRALIPAICGGHE